MTNEEIIQENRADCLHDSIVMLDSISDELTKLSQTVCNNETLANLANVIEETHYYLRENNAFSILLEDIILIQNIQIFLAGYSAILKEVPILNKFYNTLNDLLNELNNYTDTLYNKNEKRMLKDLGLFTFLERIEQKQEAFNDLSSKIKDSAAMSDRN